MYFAKIVQIVIESRIVEENVKFFTIGFEGDVIHKSLMG